MIFAAILVVMAALTTWLYAITGPAQAPFAEKATAKILAMHVPPAMQCSLFFLWGAVMAIAMLVKKRPGFDFRSQASIEVGAMFAIIATILGMIFAQRQWGVAWDWDVRQVGILVQILIYAAYFALRALVPVGEARRANAAAYAIFAFLTVPVLIWALPRLRPSSHESANNTIITWQLDTDYGRLFLAAFFTILLTGIWCYRTRVRELEARAKKEDEHGHDDSLDTAAGDSVARPVRIRDPE